MAVVLPPPKKRNPRAFAAISKHNKQTDHLPLTWTANFYSKPSPMSCAKMDALPREDPAAGGNRVDPIAARLRRRLYTPDAGDESGFEAN